LRAATDSILWRRVRFFSLDGPRKKDSVMINNPSLPRLRTIRITVAQRNSRWDVSQDDLPTPVIDCACREDALDYALGMAARSGDAIVETKDDRGFIVGCFSVTQRKMRFHGSEGELWLGRVSTRSPPKYDTAQGTMATSR
jgi:hypothetical protein